MTRCDLVIDHQRHGALRCAAPAEDRSDRCPQHRRRDPAPEPDGGVVLVVDDGCVVWGELEAYHRARRGRPAAELFRGALRPLAWLPSIGLWVDVAAWLYLEQLERPRPAGTFQRCSRPGCVAPEHAVEPRRRAVTARVDLGAALDRRFGLGAA